MSFAFDFYSFVSSEFFFTSKERIGKKNRKDKGQKREKKKKSKSSIFFTDVKVKFLIYIVLMKFDLLRTEFFNCIFFSFYSEILIKN